jgi:hypothetical protein
MYDNLTCTHFPMHSLHTRAHACICRHLRCVCRSESTARSRPVLSGFLPSSAVSGYGSVATARCMMVAAKLRQSSTCRSTSSRERKTMQTMVPVPVCSILLALSRIAATGRRGGTTSHISPAARGHGEWSIVSGKPHFWCTSPFHTTILLSYQILLSYRCIQLRIV